MSEFFYAVVSHACAYGIGALTGAMVMALASAASNGDDDA